MTVKDTVLDPVCGMSVDPETAPHEAAHRGHGYVFCGPRCRERFVAEPERFLSPPPSLPPISESGQWTCPMHPEIIRDRPGTWRRGRRRRHPELADMTRRFWACLVLPASRRASTSPGLACR